MSSFILESDNRSEIAQLLNDDAWVIACLCAAWCGTCGQYRDTFGALSARHPDKRFIWIDIEDQADVVGDLDVENFPTLLIQRRDAVAFFGTVLPDLRVADRLIQAQSERTEIEIVAEAESNPERRAWQNECNLRIRLEEANT
ncbi:MAG: thioredoxin [Noviherbaspirillum sp.]|jgi:thioredoxin 1|nr:thioredoxin [Noviherbaspirillum sp.]MDB5795380.1 thioredoxin [Noviherbaspirillum sp.]